MLSHPKDTSSLNVDVKMEDFCQKARLVSGGHMTDVPSTVKYASVVSREMVCIALTIAALNALKVMAPDIMNDYIIAPNKEKIWKSLGPEFGKDKGQKAIIVRAVSRLNSSGKAFQSHFTDCMRHLGCKPNQAYPDLWIKVCTMETTIGPKKYYSYMQIYVNYILCIYDDQDSVLTKLDKFFLIKPDLVGEPDMYLGAKLTLMQLVNYIWAWGFSVSKHMQEAVCNCNCMWRRTWLSCIS